MAKERHANIESLYEYGSRAGFWRLHRLLTKYKTPLTVYAVGMALERNPEAAKAMVPLFLSPTLFLSPSLFLLSA